ncbi:MAG: hypothetical protein JXP34_20315 [Planctomycetes bacterium]|nr:hypothetical protein [Planctomycetota bacterium]
MQRYWERFRAETSALWGRLSRTQRLIVLGVVAVAALGMVAAGVLGGAPDYRTLGSYADAAQVETMTAELARRGLDVRREGTAIQVRAEELPRALAAAGEISQSGRHQAWSWLWQDPKWGETGKRIEAKEILSRVADLEEAIEMVEDVSEAHIVLNLPPRGPLLLASEGGSSASVTVGLRNGAETLGVQAVRIIREIVSGGTGIRREDVRVADHRKAYPAPDEAAGGGTFDELHRAAVAYYERKIAGLLSSVFRTDAFTVMVDLQLDRESVRTESQEYAEPVAATARTTDETEKELRTAPDPAVGVGSNVRVNEPSRIEPITVGERTRERLEEEKDVRFGETRETKTRAPGDLKKISVLVRLDKKAAADVILADRRVLEGDDAKVSQQDLDTYVETWKLDIGKALGIRGASEVSVRLDSLTSDAVAAVREVAPQGFLRRHTAALVLGAFALLAIIAVYAIARRSIPGPIELPTLETLAAAEEQDGKHSPASEVEIVPDAVSESAQTTGEWIRKNPEPTAVLLRLWLSGEGKKGE